MLHKFKYNNSIPITIFHPNDNDEMVRQMVLSKNFYEHGYLRYIERNSAELFERKNLVMVDIGANIGNHSIFFSKILKAKVWSYEPYKKAYKALVKNLELNGIMNANPKNFGISDISSKIGVKKEVGHMLGSTEWSEESTKDSIRCEPLDDIISEPVDLIKIDVEGMEMRVLDGAERIIDEFSPVIMIEVSAIGGVQLHKEEFNRWMELNNYEYLKPEIFRHYTHLIRRRK